MMTIPKWYIVMKLVFLDESGFSTDWKVDKATQRYFVLAGLVLDPVRYQTHSALLNEEVGRLGLNKFTHPLGRGFEIKAKEILSGNGWWSRHPQQRSKMRDLMLSFAKTCDGASFVIVIDKEKLQQEYSQPIDPHKLALRFMFERVQHYLEEVNDTAICVSDQAHRFEVEIYEFTNSLLRTGSTISVYDWNGYPSSINFSLARIIDFCVARSEYCFGIQVADYLASFTFHYLKSKNRERCDWWNDLVRGLHGKSGRIAGIGFKKFPSDKSDPIVV